MVKKEEDSLLEEEMELETHTALDGNRFIGKVVDLDTGLSEVHLEITEEMVADSDGFIHTGYLFSSASFAATAATNEKNGFVIGASVHFLTPVREYDKIVFLAKARHLAGHKRVVEVVGKLGEVMVFRGDFTIIVTESHILSLKLDEITVK
jgi:acyl-coenzyme A thioesterase PaaI-like protein